MTIFYKKVRIGLLVFLWLILGTLIGLNASKVIGATRPAPQPVVKKVEVIKEVAKNGFVLDAEMTAVNGYIQTKFTRVPKEVSEMLAYYIVTTSRKHKLPVPLVIAMAKVESIFNPVAQSSKGAKGLLQILECGNIEIDEKQVFNLEYNLDKGIEILKAHIAEKKNLPSALTGYSGGAKDYPDEVFKVVGKYTLYKEGLM
jgi:soluble lytic murein transglycosylase-like protein